MGHARALSSLDRARDQSELANRIIADHLNVRQTEELIRKWKQDGKKGKTPPVEGQKPDANVRAAEQKMQEKLGTKVTIHNIGDKGKIEIYFHDQDDLIRIFDLIIGE